MITLFGAPGAGKTIQGQLLARKYGWRWVSYRDLLMGLNDKDIVFALEHGLFIDDKKATKAVAELLSKIDGGRHITVHNKSSILRTTNSAQTETILDGFPADYRQLKWMVDNRQIDNLEGAIVLRVPRGELWRRLVLRKRVDDTRAAIERRQDAYERNITGMIKTLKTNGVPVREVDGGNSPQDVLVRIEDVLADWGLVPKKQYAKISKSTTPLHNHLIR